MNPAKWYNGRQTRLNDEQMTVTQTPAGPRVFYSVLRNYHKISNIMDRILRLEGLTTGQYTALSFIKRFEPCTSAELARRQNITAQSMG